jgi:hypothetical protein
MVVLKGRLSRDEYFPNLFSLHSFEMPAVVLEYTGVCEGARSLRGLWVEATLQDSLCPQERLRRIDTHGGSMVGRRSQVASPGRDEP